MDGCLMNSVLLIVYKLVMESGIEGGEEPVRKSKHQIHEIQPRCGE